MHPIEETQADPGTPPGGVPVPGRLLLALCAATVVLGGVHAWIGRHQMNPDGICYLDMGEAYMRCDWKMAVNAHWSPLYAWVVGLTLRILTPSPSWEFPTVHLVNFLVFLGALGSFSLFLCELLRFRRDRILRSSPGQAGGLPDWALPALGYALFLWCSLPLMLVSPDMSIGALVYLACAILVRIRNGWSGWRSFALLGLVLGLAYLAKAPMFVLAFVFLGCAFFLVGDVRRAAFRVLSGLGVFLLVGGPFAVVLSVTKGRPTFGDSGRLNYAWKVNGVPEYVHWQGGPPGCGTPVHPTRKLLDMPALYEFATPIGGTYPAWYDPSYWHEGLTLRFDPRPQVRALAAGAQQYFHFFYHWQGGLIAGVLALYLMGFQRRSTVRFLLAHWFLFVPALAALGMYALVFVSLRYVAPFMLILWAGLLSGVRLPDNDQLRKPVTCVCAAMLAMLVIAIGVAMTGRGGDLATAGGNARAQGPAAWRIADALGQMGVRRGAKVGFIGDSFTAYWARLARVQITAEIPAIRGGAEVFRAAYPLVLDRVVEAFTKAGVDIIVAEKLPDDFSRPGWRRIGNTDHFVYFVRR